MTLHLSQGDIRGVVTEGGRDGWCVPRCGDLTTMDALLCPFYATFASMTSSFLCTNFLAEGGKVPLHQYGNTTLWKIESLLSVV